LNRHPCSNKFSTSRKWIPIYFYSQTIGKWFTIHIDDQAERVNDDKIEFIASDPKRPEGIWAGVGSRVISERTMEEIKKL
jgi:hypothetical protein